MLSFASKNRVTNILVIIFILIFAVVIITIILRNNDDMVAYKSDLLENIITMEDINLKYIIDNNTFVLLKSKTGNANILNYNFALQNLNINYNSKEYSIDAFAEKGTYVAQRFIKAYDNITGFMDNMSFYTGINGVLEYDYKTGKGNILNDVFVFQGPNSISSKAAFFDVNSNYIVFKDNVTVNYIPDNK